MAAPAMTDQASAKRIRDPDRPGYIAPFRTRHRNLTSTLKNEEHQQFSERAKARGISPTTLASQVLREYLAREVPTVPDDNFEDSTLVYGDGEG